MSEQQERDDDDMATVPEPGQGVAAGPEAEPVSPERLPGERLPGERLPGERLPGERAVHPQPEGETGGPKGPEPTRFGDWEKNGRCFDF